MKYLLIALLISPLISAAQVYVDSSSRSSISNPVWKLSKYSGNTGYGIISSNYEPDTMRVMLQVSNSKAMRVCYAIPGYVTLLPDSIIFLDRKKKRLDPRLTVWQYVKVEETKRRGR